MLFLITHEKICQSESRGKEEDPYQKCRYGEGGRRSKFGVARHHICSEEHGDDRPDRKPDDHEKRRCLMLGKQIGENAREKQNASEKADDQRKIQENDPGIFKDVIPVYTV